MSLNSKGCYACVDFEKNLSNGNIIAILKTYKYDTYKKKRLHEYDFVKRVVLLDKGVRLYTGDLIWISGFFVCTWNNSVSVVITEWKVVKRNGFTKPKSQVEYEKEKNRQRRQIEEEIEAEEQDLDEYIENNGEDDCPF